MHNLSNSLPDQLPGIQVAFALKQCLGKQDLLITLLNKFWEDYGHADDKLAEDNMGSDQAETFLHDLQGAATNLGLSKLGEICQQQRSKLKTEHSLNKELNEQFHMELEKVGSSIKTLDSIIQN